MRKAAVLQLPARVRLRALLYSSLRIHAPWVLDARGYIMRLHPLPLCGYSGSLLPPLFDLFQAPHCWGVEKYLLFLWLPDWGLWGSYRTSPTFYWVSLQCLVPDLAELIYALLPARSLHPDDVLHMQLWHGNCLTLLSEARLAPTSLHLISSLPSAATPSIAGPATRSPWGHRPEIFSHKVLTGAPDDWDWDFLLSNLCKHVRWQCNLQIWY